MDRESNDRFDKSFEQWARRPSATPADEAANRLLRRLSVDSKPRPVARLRFAAVATAMVLGVLATRLLYVGPPASEPAFEDRSLGELAQIVPPPLPEGVALIWIDADTPLYLTVTPPQVSDQLQIPNQPPTSEGEPTP